MSDIDFDPILSRQLDLLLPEPINPVGDWASIVRAATGRSRRRRRITFAVAAAAFVLLVTPALALRGSVIDFFSADPAPKTVVVEFRQLETAVPKRFASGVVAGEARQVAGIESGGKAHVLYIAPTTHGGYCDSWATIGMSACLRKRHGLTVGTFVYSSETPQLGIDAISGSVLVPNAKVTVHFADAKTVELPYVFVTAPINAGFFLYVVPPDRKVGRSRPTAVTVTRANGTLIRLPIENISETTRVVTHMDRWGRQLQMTPEAAWDKRRVLFNFNATDGALATLFVMPSRYSESRRCYWGNGGSGCVPRRRPADDEPVSLHISGGAQSVLLSGDTDPRIRRLKLQYQDGTSEEAKVVEGFVLTELLSPHSLPGHRLVTATGYDKDGKIVGRQVFHPLDRGLYPCDKLKHYGNGVVQCP